MKFFSSTKGPSENPNLNEIQNREVHQIIGQRLHSYRDRAWEDDISRFTLDTKPFENLPSPDSFSQEQLDQTLYRFSSGILKEQTLAEIAAKDALPIPSADDREGYFPGLDQFYWAVGLLDYLKVIEVAKERGVEIRSYFDFGCATGRVLRHFATQTDIPTLWGSDINARHIRWLQEFMPQQVRPLANHCIPSLPIPDNSVDVISAFSVFTHIDTFETCWLAELSRILSPGGFAYLTIHSETTWDLIRDEIDNKDDRLAQSLIRIDPGFRDQVQNPMPEGRTVFRFMETGPYRAQVFHSTSHIQRVWGRFFKVEALLHQHHDKQAVVLLTKR